MVKDNSTLKLKNHVTPKARRINQVLKTKFGVSLAYQTKVINEALNRGDDARFDLITQKNYQPNTVRGVLAEKFAAIKSALGF